MTAQDQQSREEFDTWWNEFAPSGFDRGAGYEKTFAYAAWKAQADRAAAQVLDMGRVPPGNVAVPIEPTSKQVVLMAGAILQQKHGTADTRHAYWPQAVEQAEKAYRSAIDFAPQPPSAQVPIPPNSTGLERKPLDRIAVLVKIDAVLCKEKNPLQAAEEICAMANQGITHPTGD